MVQVCHRCEHPLGGYRPDEGDMQSMEACKPQEAPAEDTGYRYTAEEETAQV